MNFQKKDEILSLFYNFYEDHISPGKPLVGAECWYAIIIRVRRITGISCFQVKKRAPTEAPLLLVYVTSCLTAFE